MGIAVIVALALACAALAGYLAVLDRGLARAGRRLEEQLDAPSALRLEMPCPNAAAEALLARVNALLERRQAERDEYHRLEEDLRRQIADVSHDLRTPLTSILGYLQLLEDDGLTPAQRREYLSVVRGRAATLQTLITAFYDLSRLEGGQWTPAREPLDLGRVVQDQIASAYETLERAGMPPSVEIPEGLPPVWGDPNGVVRVVSNLLTNALVHGRPPLAVRLRRTEAGVEAAFTNAAPGMTPQEADQVFRRFYTASPSRANRTSGVGLAIVKVLMERMGGAASARLEDGAFTVRVTWPLADSRP